MHAELVASICYSLQILLIHTVRVPVWEITRWSWWRHQMETFPRYRPFLWGIHRNTGEFSSQRPVTQSFDFSLIYAWRNAWVNNLDASDLRRHCAHYDVTVMEICSTLYKCVHYKFKEHTWRVWFWVCVQPMRDGVTFKWSISLTGCKPRISPVWTECTPKQYGSDIDVKKIHKTSFLLLYFWHARHFLVSLLLLLGQIRTRSSADKTHSRLWQYYVVYFMLRRFFWYVVYHLSLGSCQSYVASEL